VNIGDADAVAMAVFSRSWNTLYCSFDLSRRGYYAQALNLLRAPVEDIATYWFVRATLLARTILSTQHSTRLE
jgi:hypothetical protein